MNRLITKATAFLCLLAVSPAAPAQGENLGTIIGKTAIPEVIDIRVTSNSPEVKALMERAFDLHGAFNPSAPKPQVEIIFQLQSAQAIAVAVRDLGSGNILEQTTIQSDSPRKVALLAGDWAVGTTTGKPGFFAGTVAFISNHSGAPELYLGDPLMTEVRQRTSDRSHCLSPAFSPGGRKILYSTYFKSGYADIYSIDTQTGAREPFAAYQGTNSGGVYSPDGRSVAMVLSGTGNPELYVSDYRGKNIRRLVKSHGLESHPSWSPDGRNIVFSSTEAGRPQLFVIAASGGQMKRLPTNISGNCTEPEWNPANPNLIAFTALMGREFEVAVFDTASKKSVVLTKGIGDAIEPTWLNDGRHIIFTQRNGTVRKLVLLDTYLGTTRNLHSSRIGSAWQSGYVYAP